MVPPQQLEPLIDACEQFDTAYWADVEIQRFTKDRDSKKDSKKEDAKAAKTAKPEASTSAISPKANKQGSKPANNASKSSTSNTPAAPGTSTTTLPLGTDGRLTVEERARRMKDNLCLYCGAKGHKSIECPKRKATAAAAKPATTRATVTIEPENSKAAQ
jgi:hypothetical protein